MFQGYNSITCVKTFAGFADNLCNYNSSLIQIYRVGHVALV